MSEASSYQFYDQNIESENVHSELISNFSLPQKTIAPKFFYDQRGSELFTEITRTLEYYPTKTEIGILRDHGAEIASCIGQNSLLIEYGAGNGEKIRLLLNSLRPSVYAPLDISSEYLNLSANAIAKEFPWLEVKAACVDYNQTFELPFETSHDPVAGFFPGSSIGNFEPDAAIEFLKRVKLQLGEDAGLVVGVDLKKDQQILNAAYNDAVGITASFNLNVLSHLNNEYQANFDQTLFRHHAKFNEDRGCIEMFLESLVEQTVNLAGESFQLKQGEMIHTENSFKYSIGEFTALAKEAGFAQSRYWTDENAWFGIFYLR